jgi:hypothetical protein
LLARARQRTLFLGQRDDFYFWQRVFCRFQPREESIYIKCEKNERKQNEKKIEVARAACRAGSSRCTARQGVGSPSCLPLSYIV